MIVFKKNILSQAINREISKQHQQFASQRRWAGFADAKPSESIQKHELPGLAIAVLFPHKPGVGLLDIPVKQFKDARKPKQKVNNARKLTDWLHEQKDDGLDILGFCLTQTQLTAAKYGLNLIEELPGVHVEQHYDKFRLFFSERHIDFAQAVALEYYLFAAYFGILRPSLSVQNLGISLNLYMDRFPGASIGNLQPGQPIPKTDGMRFIEYVQEHSDTYRTIDDDHKSHNIVINFTTLDWWTPLEETQLRKGKTHPHFLLPDWLAAASIANEYRGEFIATIPSHKIGVQLADSCEELYKAFKNFDIWSLDDKALSHFIGSERRWEVPQEAREFILNRAHR